MPKALHPSLHRIYNASQNDEDTEFLYFDETYLMREEGYGESFYAITAAKFSKRDLCPLRDDLIDIVGEDLFKHKHQPYWHATEALQTTEGKEIFEDFVEYLSSYGDQSFITCETPIPEMTPEEGADKGKTLTATENARRDCLRKMFEEFSPSFQNVRGFIFEEREDRSNNNRDRNFMKKLKQDGLLNKQANNAWVSPRQEIALWVPDTVGMAYRRTRTHADETSDFFFDYLNKITEVIEF